MGSAAARCVSALAIAAAFAGFMCTSVSAADRCGDYDPAKLRDLDIGERTDGNWKYGLNFDDLTGKRADTASTVSSRIVPLPFPYQGGSFLSFSLQQYPSSSFLALLKVSKGQFNCAYSGCPVAITFDGGKVERFIARVGASGRGDTLIFAGSKAVLKRVQAAQTMRVEVEFYAHGLEVFEFAVAGLKWPPPC